MVPLTSCVSTDYDAQSTTLLPPDYLYWTCNWSKNKPLYS